MLRKLLPREDQYFDLFVQMTNYIVEAVRELRDMLNDKQPNYAEYSQRIKRLEHACDELTHTISTKLNKSFITPFDREDIYLMSSALDDIVDLIDDAARAIIIFDVREIKPSRRICRRVGEDDRAAARDRAMLQKPKNLTQRLLRYIAWRTTATIFITSNCRAFQKSAIP